MVQLSDKKTISKSGIEAKVVKSFEKLDNYKLVVACTLRKKINLFDFSYKSIYRKFACDAQKFFKLKMKLIHASSRFSDLSPLKSSIYSPKIIIRIIACPIY